MTHLNVKLYNPIFSCVCVCVKIVFLIQTISLLAMLNFSYFIWFCPQDTVTITCTVQSGGALVWRAEPIISEANEISFIPNDSMKNMTFTSRGVIFHAVLIQSDPVFQSTLSTIDSATTNGTAIECLKPFTGVRISQFYSTVTWLALLLEKQ